MYEMRATSCALLIISTGGRDDNTLNFEVCQLSIFYVHELRFAACSKIIAIEINPRFYFEGIDA